MSLLKFKYVEFPRANSLLSTDIVILAFILSGFIHSYIRWHRLWDPLVVDFFVFFFTLLFWNDRLTCSSGVGGEAPRCCLEPELLRRRALSWIFQSFCSSIHCIYFWFSIGSLPNTRLALWQPGSMRLHKIPHVSHALVSVLQFW